MQSNLIKSLNTVSISLLRIIRSIKAYIFKAYSYSTHKPFTSFLILMAAILALILTSFIINKPKLAEAPIEPPAKMVEVYSPGISPKVTTSGVINKHGVIEIFAQTSGVISSVYKSDGQKVAKGQTILNIASNYLGANASSISRQMAEKSYQNMADTYQDRLNIIKKSIEVAKDSNETAENIREINKDSIDRTRDIININTEVISVIDNAISDTSDSAKIAELKAQKAGLLAAVNQLKTSLDLTKNQTEDESNDEKVSENTKDIAVKNLDLEKKALSLALETSKLQLQIARVSESFSYPASPLTGTIEHIFVKNGDLINPGTKLAVVVSNNPSATVEIYVNKLVADNLDINALHKVYIDNKTLDLKVKSVSVEAVNNSQYSVIFDLPTSEVSNIYNDESIKVDLYMANRSTSNYLLVPIDAVFQTQSDSSVRVLSKQNSPYKIESRTIKLGRLFGSYIEILDGIKADDEIVLDRNVSIGQTVNKK